MSDDAAHHDETRRAVLDTWWEREPLGFETRDAGSACERFEFSSRGDRVEGWLRRAGGGTGAAPLIVAVSGSRAGSADPTVAGWAARWTAAGAAVAGLDLPLHGVRESVKLSDALVEAASDLDALASDRDRRRLVDEFLAQCRSDLGRALRGLAERPGVDASRALCVGSGLAALASLHGAGGAGFRAAVIVDPPPGADIEAALEGLGIPSLCVTCGGASSGPTASESLAVVRAEAVADAAWPVVANALGL